MDDRKADLHTHSYFSDGMLSPEDLVEEALWKGLSAIALTDHDTVEGLNRAIEAGNNRGIEVINGVELSCEHQGREVHILGLCFTDYDIIEKCVREVRQLRVERMRQMLDKARTHGVEIPYEEVADLAQGECIGRPHLARVMVNRGIVRNFNEAFVRHIGDEGAWYVAKTRLTTEKAIQTIKAAGGVSVLAHPAVSRIEEHIPLFTKQGLNGLEVFHSAQSPLQEKELTAIAAEFNLMIAGGSDYHGDEGSDRTLGFPSVPYAMLDKIKAAAAAQWD